MDREIDKTLKKGILKLRKTDIRIAMPVMNHGQNMQG